MDVYRLMKEYRKAKLDKQLEVLLEICSNIKRIRQEKNITQEELASMCELSRTSITNIEGAKQDLTITTLVSIAIALDIDIRDLMPNRKEE